MKDERVGLWMIVSSLAVIVVITGLLFKFQAASRREQTRVQGVSLVRLLSGIPSERLVPAARQQGPLQVIRDSQGNPDFAYGVVVNLHGEPLAEVTAPGAIVPRVSMGRDPSSWLGERVLDAPEGGRPTREFFAPVLSGGEVVGQVRIGFYDPGYAIFLEHAPFFALLALPIFLLTPLSYLLIRRELRPLAAANARIRSMLEGGPVTRIQVEADDEMGDFIRSFNRFLELGQRRLQELESERTDLFTSSKVVLYQKTRIEAVLETLPAAAIVLDEAGTVTFANAKLEALTGIPPATALGRRAEEWCELSDLRAFLARFQVVHSGLRRAEPMEFSPGESGKSLLVAAHPLLPAASGAAISGTLVLIRDITAETLAKEGQAEFVSHLAHELKSPLNVLRLYSETLLGKDGESEDFRVEACNVIHDEVERLSGLISTLLSISRIEAGILVLKRQRVRLHDFLRDTLDSVTRAAKRSDLNFDLELPNELTPIYVDKDLLRVVVNNLLTNAIKYSRDGGQVTLSAAETEEATLIRVSDNGIGIPLEDQRRIFEKFFRSEDADAQERSGHGLGLALAKQIAELHRGGITVKSVPGQGSEFALVLQKTPALLKEPT